MCNYGVAILADAQHDVGDLLAMGIAWYLQKASEKEAGSAFFLRIWTLVTFGCTDKRNGIAVRFVCDYYACHSKIFSSQAVDATGKLRLALLGIAFNGITFWQNRSNQSLNAKLVSWHLLEDVLSRSVVLICSTIMYFRDYSWMDPLMALGVTLFILWNFIKSLSGFVKFFLKSNPEGMELLAIKEELCFLKNVEDIHDVHTWSLDGKNHVLSLHVEVSHNNSFRDIGFTKK